MQKPQHNSFPLTLPRKVAAPRRQPLAVALAAAGLLATGTSSTLADPRQLFHATPHQRQDVFTPSGAIGSPSLDKTLVSSRVTFRGGELIPVSNCNDSGPGSLRAAVDTASNGDTIDLRVLDCDAIYLESQIAIPQNNLRLFGPGPDRLAIDGFSNKFDRVFDHTGAGQLYAGHLTIRTGELNEDYGNARGGCIRSAGNVFLYDSVITACHAHAPTGFATGGAIHAEGKVQLSRSVVSFNLAIGDEALGGGVFANGYLLARYSTITDNTASGSDSSRFSRAGGVFASGPSRVEHSTVSNNIADHYAGLLLLNANDEAVIKILQSTISGNSASGVVGGVYLRGNAWVLGSTITDNYAGDLTDVTTPFASGLQAGFGTSVVLKHTIAAGNHVPSGFSSTWDFGARFSSAVSGAYNAVGESVTGTVLPIDTIYAVPALGPLDDNGGPTRTHALLLSSNNPAIDGGGIQLDSPHDQRGLGFPRMLASVPGGEVRQDIGAFEYFPDQIFTNGFDLAPVAAVNRPADVRIARTEDEGGSP